jgi:hypothetical protein
MSDAKKIVSRRDTFKLASAVTALGVGLGASLASKDAGADSASPNLFNQLKLDSNKIDTITLSVHKGDATSLAVATQNLKLAPGTYALKLTALKLGSVVTSAVETITIK